MLRSLFRTKPRPTSGHLGATVLNRTARPTVYLALAALAAALPVPTPAIAASPNGPGVHTATNAMSRAQLDAYWTPKRLANAKPMELSRAGSATAPATGRTATAAAAPDGRRYTVAPVAPRTGSVTRSAAASPSVWLTIGRLYFNVPGRGDYICTANAVASNNRDVIATARHCVMDIDTGQTYQNFRFAPAYDRGSAPYGWWDWRSMGWRVDDTSPGGDNAFIVLRTGGNGNRHVVDAVGGTGLGFNWSTNNYAHGLGLPGDKDYAVWCEGQPYDGPSGGVQIPNCNGLSGGASGGAFIVNYQASDGSAYQTASYFGSWGDSYFAYYRNAALEVYQGASNA